MRAARPPTSRAMLLVALFASSALVPGAWSNVNDPPAHRAKLVVANMTLDEKLLMLHGPEYSMRDQFLWAHTGVAAEN